MDTTTLERVQATFHTTFGSIFRFTSLVDGVQKTTNGEYPRRRRLVNYAGGGGKLYDALYNQKYAESEGHKKKESKRKRSSD